jgi:F-type H+-transporting ATPase subunit epsilon
MAKSQRTSGLRCVIVTPEATVLDIPARGVVLPLEDGQLGVAPGHTPLVGRLGAGEVRITKGEGPSAVQRVFVEGGFAEVGHGTVTVITQRAVVGEKIDLAEARASLAEISGRKAAGEEAIAAKMREQAAARAVVRIAERSR